MTGLPGAPFRLEQEGAVNLDTRGFRALTLIVDDDGVGRVSRIASMEATEHGAVQTTYDADGGDDEVFVIPVDWPFYRLSIDEDAGELGLRYALVTFHEEN